MKVARLSLAIAAVLATAWIVVPHASRLADDAPMASTLPASLSDQEFWRLSTSLSEPNGFFRSENLVSNEHTFQYVVPALTQRIRPGGVYLGVAPDQNFTYMIATQPAIAFIVDIRRGNLLEHLLYKAIIELSADRAEFLSRLFSKKRPAGLGPKSTVVELFAAYDEVRTSEELYHAERRGRRDAAAQAQARVRALAGGSRADREHLLRLLLGRAGSALLVHVGSVARACGASARRRFPSLRRADDADGLERREPQLPRERKSGSAG